MVTVLEPREEAVARGVRTPGADIHYTVTSTLADMPGYSIIADSQVTGSELGELFKRQPDLPGVILLEEGKLQGVISQSHYYKCVSRNFGRELYNGRPAALMLEQETEKPLVLLTTQRIEEGVEHGLARPQAFVYEPFLVYDELADEYRLCSFQVLLLAASHIAALRNEQMAQILNTVTDGLLVIDRQLRIGHEYSRATAHLFERDDLAGYTLPEVLTPLLEGSVAGQLTDYLAALFNPKLIGKLIKTINPAKQVELRFAGQREAVKHFSFDFERIMDQGVISQVLVRVEDVTRRVLLAEELQKQEAASERKLQWMMQILRIDPVELRQYLHRFRQELVTWETIPVSDTFGDLREGLHALFRSVHTLKGEAGLLGLAAYERPLHELEDRLQALRARRDLGAVHLEELQPLFATLRELDDGVQDAMAHFEQLAPVRAGAARAPEGPRPLAMAARLVADLSRQLGKPAVFHAAVSDEAIPVVHAGVLHDLLLHLARNAMVHGIEPAAQRQARNKPAAGTIQFAMVEHPQFHEFIFQDDGAGLDEARIRRRAEERGLTIASRDDLHEVIFAPGFSTADKVSELAGRGVGLDAIRHAIRAAGGSIHVHSAEGGYCAFQVLLPRQDMGRAA